MSNVIKGLRLMGQNIKCCFVSGSIGGQGAQVNNFSCMLTVAALLGTFWF